MIRLFSRFDIFNFYGVVLLTSLFLFSFILISRVSRLKIFFIKEILISFHKITLGVQGPKISKAFLIILSTVFFYLGLRNYFSIFSFIFPTNSQMSLVLVLSLRLWLGFVLFSIFKNLARFISHCVPEGTPLLLVCFLFVIELVRQVIRPLTLTVRLVANILAGHLLMILLSKLALDSLVSFVPYLILNIVEMFVALIQAYIIVTMITLYYGEVL